MSSLWEALGRPCLVAPLPGPRSLGWRVACAALQRCVLGRGVRARIRSAAVLWRALNGGPPRVGADWRQLCELGDVDTLVGALRLREVVGSVRFATWNVRWLLSPHTERAAAKHAELGRALRGGNVVLLQETHWTAAAAAQWGGLFSAARVAHSVAREGPRGGPQGGVAVVVPLPHRILETREVVPGCVLEVVFAVCGTQRRVSFVSIYLPPDGRNQVLDALQGMEAPAAPEVYAGGDVNMQLHAPRDDGERDDGERLQAILARWGSCSIDDGRVTRRSRTSQASLDILAFLGWDAWS